jgi:hypothetical protein
MVKVERTHWGGRNLNLNTDRASGCRRTDKAATLDNLLLGSLKAEHFYSLLEIPKQLV